MKHRVLLKFALRQMEVAFCIQCEACKSSAMVGDCLQGRHPAIFLRRCHQGQGLSICKLNQQWPRTSAEPNCTKWHVALVAALTSLT